MRRPELHRVQHLHVGVVLGVGVRAFDPSLGVGWREILSWYLVEWTMEMVMDLGGAHQEFPSTGDVGSPDWHWDPRGTTYHFPCIPIDYDLEGIFDLPVERAPPLGEFQSAPVANQFMDRLLGLPFYDDCTQDHRMISILW